MKAFLRQPGWAGWVLAVLVALAFASLGRWHLGLLWAATMLFYGAGAYLRGETAGRRAAYTEALDTLDELLNDPTDRKDQP